MYQKRAFWHLGRSLALLRARVGRRFAPRYSRSRLLSGLAKTSVLAKGTKLKQIPNYLRFLPLIHLLRIATLPPVFKPPLPPQGGRLGGLSSVGGWFSFPPPPPEGDGGRRNAPPPSPMVCGVCRRQGFGAVSPSLRALDRDVDPADPGRLFHPLARKSLLQLRLNDSTILSAALCSYPCDIP